MTSADRYPQLPDIPIVREQGIAIDAQSWWGLLAPARTSNDIIARMHDAMTKALEEPAVRRSLSGQGVVYRLSSPAVFGQFIEAEVARWAKVVKDNKIVAAD